jgi:MFS family permease
MLTFLALPMLVYNATGSKAALSLTIFIGGVPSILIGPFAGAWADRGNRRRVMAACDLARAAVTIPILLVPEPWLVTTIYIVVGIKSVLGSFFQPAMSSVIPALVDRDRLITINSLFTFSMRTLQFLIPLLGVYLISTLGLRVLLGLDIASFLISAWLIGRTTLPFHAGMHHHKITVRSLGHDIHEGLRFIGGSWVLRIILLTGLIVQFGQGFISPAWLPYMVEVLEQPAETFGVLVSLQGLGCVVGSIVLLAIGIRKKSSVKGLYLLFLAGVGVTIFLQVTTTNFVVFLGWATLAGFFIAGRGAATSTMIQHATDQAVMGRVTSTLQIFNRVALMTAVALVGVSAGILSTRLLFILACSIYLAGCLLGTLLMAFVPEPDPNDRDQPKTELGPVPAGEPPE